MVDAFRQRFLVALLLSACGLGCGALPQAPAQLPPHPRETSRGIASDTLPRAALFPGDLVHVELLTSPPRAYPGLEVDALGRLHVPGLGDVPVSGLTEAEAEAALQHLLQMHDHDARAYVSLLDARGQRVTVLGAVARQGSFQISPGMRVGDAIAAAGGPLAALPVVNAPTAMLADLSRAGVIRNGKRLPISIPAALEGSSLHNVYVRPGDHIHMPLRARNPVSVLGQVRGPRVVPHHDGMRLTEALALAGGLTPDGDKSDIRLVRGPADRPEVYAASLAAIVDGTDVDVTLAPGDVVFVTDDPLEDVREVFQLLAPLAGLASTALLLALISAQ